MININMVGISGHCGVVNSDIEVVIITDWGKDKNLRKMLKIQQIFPKLYKDLLYVVYHNLES